MRSLLIDDMVIRRKQIEQLDEVYRNRLFAKVLAAVEAAQLHSHSVSTSEALTGIVKQGLQEARKLRIKADAERIAYVMLCVHRATGAISLEHFDVIRRDIEADSKTAIAYEQNFRSQLITGQE